MRAKYEYHSLKTHSNYDGWFLPNFKEFSTLIKELSAQKKIANVF